MYAVGAGAHGRWRHLGLIGLRIDSCHGDIAKKLLATLLLLCRGKDFMASFPVAQGSYDFFFTGVLDVASP